MNSVAWRLLFVDDDIGFCEQAREFLQGETISDSEQYPVVVTETDFTEALSILETQRFDLVILDVRLGSHEEFQAEEFQAEEAGIGTLEAIRERLFVPVIFYTGLPNPSVPK